MSTDFFPPEQQPLWALIEERVDSKNKPEVDQRIWDQFSAEGAIAFTDLQGFTKRTEQHGITHFLEIVYRSQVLLRPVIAKHNGMVIEVVADSMMLWFDDVDDSVRCGIEMQQSCRDYNRQHDPEEQLLLCLGIGYGRVLKVGNTRLAGPQVNVASKLGEDTAEGYEILVTKSVKENVTNPQEFNFDLTGVEFPGSSEVYRVNY